MTSPDRFGGYLSLPEETRNRITEEEFKILNEIQNHFKEAVNYLDRFFKNEDEDSRQNLYYIVHDWIGEHGKEYNRNDALVSELKVASDILDRIDKAMEIQN